MNFSDADKFAEAKRELAMRRRVYPNLVGRGKLSQADADRRIALMEAIMEDYRPKGLFDQ